ncbi:hypothetical protein HMPREF9005_1173 [Actinomyces sp. oral taxon 178 str. F0338]|nr:hypothetical protein HMPREF9005_1173 [Actinomyces sp. oral taxon 178 str. F0338]
MRGKLDGGRPVLRGDRLIPARAGKTTVPGTVPKRKRAHPRACGENVRVCGAPPGRAGSSPRVRGKLGDEGYDAVGGGLIPARAGKTAIEAGKALATAAHPRACGENSLMSARASRNSGSSPRVRGKHGLDQRNGQIRGLIPARAGKTGWRRRRWAGRPAHPRACGENGHRGGQGPGNRGSSPRVRGKRPGSEPSRDPRGLIPARAGKTSSPSSSMDDSTAHPRACGENLVCGHGASAPRGSSPRVRGKRRRYRLGRRSTRLIPARAGKTYRVPFEMWATRAHPRACGENALSRAIPAVRGAHPRACGENARVPMGAVTCAGSSPRVRGKRSSWFGGRGPPGLIPARAGKTGRQQECTRRRTAHPRACGENLSVRIPTPARSGSSPRVRGKLEGVAGEPQPGGLIPARAGKTFFTDAEDGVAGAHPRACGENTYSNIEQDWISGSSPRVRGKPGRGREVEAVAGLIPARAGKTALSPTRARRWWAHPRACGENSAPASAMLTAEGSSPRVRGKLGW